MMNLFNMNVSPDLAHSYWTKGFFYGIWTCSKLDFSKKCTKHKILKNN